MTCRGPEKIVSGNLMRMSCTYGGNRFDLRIRDPSRGEPILVTYIARTAIECEEAYSSIRRTFIGSNEDEPPIAITLIETIGEGKKNYFTSGEIRFL